jgi:Dolichyl-phosphate-mannose-protein mannosyltransferase
MIASNKAEDAGPSSVAVPTWQSVRTLRSLADLIDRRPALVLPIWIIVYFAVLWRAAHRPLWYDELFTYYVSTAPTWAKFMGGMKFVDLNPPLSYLFVRSSIALFGDSPFATRLPSLLGFLAASLIVYVLITRRLGGGLGLAALGFLWSFSLTGYAVEARPYGLLLCFFSVGMLCWLNAAEASRWTKWHAGLTVAIGAMLVTHCFSPVLVAAIGVGELVRNIVRKRIDKKVWAALLAPLSLVLIYLPLVRNAQSLSMPRSFQATLSTIPLFFVRISFSALPAIGVILVLWLIRGKGTVKVRLRDLAQPHEIAFCFAALFLPTAIIGYCIWSGVAFWERYGIGAALGGCLMLTALLAMATRRNVRASVAAAAVILILFCLTNAAAGGATRECLARVQDDP